MITKPLTEAVHLEKENLVPIFSIDISPRGDCFATGGEDGVVKLWSFLKALDPDALSPWHLADIKTHEKPVNSVRFSESGRLLASGGSDGVVAVAVWGGKEHEWHEWRQWHQQKLDISEVAWGTRERSKLLASSSFDGTIVIWNVEEGHACHIMTGHKNMIKGIAWDPLGQYLASQADTEGIYIWRTSDWKCTKQISESFGNAVDTSDHLRLSWSPDGSYLAGVQAYELPQPYVAVLKRDRWSVDFCIVGHRSAVTISKWNPGFYVSHDSDGRQPLMMCLALGSADHTFSFWRQNSKHPICHINGFFDNRVSDISWSRDGYTCLISSRDGCVALCNFTEADLGVRGSHKVSPTEVLPTSSKMPVVENLQLWASQQAEVQEKRGRRENDVTVSDTPPKRQRKTSAAADVLARVTLPSTSVPRTHSILVSPRRQAPTTSTGSAFNIQSVPETEEIPQLREKRQNRMSLSYPCGKRRSVGGKWSAVLISAKNENGSDRCIVACTEDERELWRDEIQSKTVALTGNLHFTAVATEDNTLQVYNEIGVQMISAMKLPSSISLLVCDAEWHLMSLTLCGELSLWNVEHRKLLCRTSVCSFCRKSQLSSMRLTGNVLPMVVMADGQSFLYNRSLEAWTVYRKTAELRTGHAGAETNSEKLSLDALSIATSPADVRRSLEQNMRNAVDIENPIAYQKWLLAYGRHLISRIRRDGTAAKEEETRLRRLCSDLMHDIDSHALGVPPIEFLQNRMLPEMIKGRDLQRLVDEVLGWMEHM